jgi:uncharacterized protein YceH (UPF0502 family)
MRWRRRRSQQGREPSIELVPVERTERALVALAFQAQQLGNRVDRLESRLERAEDATLDLPTHDDVLEVRLHSARVAAELARVAVELRAEIERAITAAQATAPHTSTPRERRVLELAETVIDLSDRLDTLPADLLDRPRGWAATA